MAPRRKLSRRVLHELQQEMGIKVWIKDPDKHPLLRRRFDDDEKEREHERALTDSYRDRAANRARKLYEQLTERARYDETGDRFYLQGTSVWREEGREWVLYRNFFDEQQRERMRDTIIGKAMKSPDYAPSLPAVVEPLPATLDDLTAKIVGLHLQHNEDNNKALALIRSATKHMVLAGDVLRANEQLYLDACGSLKAYALAAKKQDSNFPSLSWVEKATKFSNFLELVPEMKREIFSMTISDAEARYRRINRLCGNAFDRRRTRARDDYGLYRTRWENLPRIICGELRDAKAFLDRDRNWQKQLDAMPEWLSIALAKFVNGFEQQRDWPELLRPAVINGAYVHIDKDEMKADREDEKAEKEETKLDDNYDKIPIDPADIRDPDDSEELDDDTP